MCVFRLHGDHVFNVSREGERLMIMAKPSGSRATLTRQRPRLDLGLEAQLLGFA